jgi:hypothetical protein
MDAKDHREQSAHKNDICSLEWIAWAIEAVRRHKDAAESEPALPPRPAAWRQPANR